MPGLTVVSRPPHTPNRCVVPTRGTPAAPGNRQGAYSVVTLVLNFTKPHRGDWRDRRLLSRNTLEMSCHDPLTKINLTQARASAPGKEQDHDRTSTLRLVHRR
jgi:hypothetical protein